MPAQNSTITSDLQKLEILNNQSLNNKIKNALNLINEEDSKKVMLEVLKFLFLIAKTDDILTPSIEVDKAWHEFILHTRIYDKFCQKNFGRFIHHTPGGDQKENIQRFKHTLALYTLNYGQPVQPWWPKIKLDTDLCGSCLAN